MKGLECWERGRPVRNERVSANSLECGDALAFEDSRDPIRERPFSILSLRFALQLSLTLPLPPLDDVQSKPLEFESDLESS